MGTDLDTRTTGYTDVATTRSGGTARTLSIVAFVCAGLSLLFLPILFGPAAIICGVIGWRKGDRLGLWAAIVGAVCMVASIAIGAAILSSRNH